MLAQRQIPDKGSEISELVGLVAELNLAGKVGTDGDETLEQRGAHGDLVALRADLDLARTSCSPWVAAASKCT